ncbi:hypothetical protein CFP56_003201 [Quercus suber]|uniref:PGG domain-containing protein n=1 Tax=Quercus suber TaxID=58331 RepID=A0AAW0IIZ1_QUESU
MKNEKGETPYVLFAMEHEDLRKEGEKWMMNTAKSSMVVATLISSIMFSGLPTDGLSHNSKKYNLELTYSVSSATTLFCSSTSLIMFLCTLTSRIPVYIAALFGLFAYVPILYVFLKYRQFVDIIQSTCCRFQPRQCLL